MPAVFLCLLSAFLIPYLLRTVFFTVSGTALTTPLQSAITILSLAVSAFCYGIAALSLLGLPSFPDNALYAAIRLFCFGVPAVYLEFRVFCVCFEKGALLPRSVIALIPAVLAVYAASHTALWLSAILYEQDAILPSADLWGKTWRLHLKSPLSALGRFAALLLTFWSGAVLFPLLSERVLVFLYRTVWGSVLLAIVYALVLTCFVHFTLRLASETVIRVFPAVTESFGAEPDPDKDRKAIDLDFAAKDNARNNPSSAEELLLEKGLLTKESAYGKPAAILTDADIPVTKPLLPEHVTFRDFIPLVILLLLLAFLGGTALFRRTTATGAVDTIISDTQVKAAAEERAGRSIGVSDAYMAGLGDLEAFDAYLNAVAGGAGNERLNEESAQLETYGELFKQAEDYSDTSPLPYLLEAKLLLLDGHPELAAEVLEYMIDYEYATDETYLLLLTSLREAGRTDSDSYRNARKVCVSRRVYTDSLAYLDPLSVRDAQVISRSMQDAKTAFFKNGQLFLWQSYRENGEIETAYNGLYALLEDERFAEDADVLRAFIETGSAFHVRFDGTADGIDAFYALTAEKALLYDRIYTVSLAAGERSDYTLVEVKRFVGAALVACRRYADACSYLSEALARYTSDDELSNLYRISYTGLTDEERETIPSYEALIFNR